MYTVLNYVGADNDRGGVIAVVRALASTGQFGCLLGVSPNYVGAKVPPLDWVSFPAIEHEKIGLKTLLRGRVVAREVRKWLRADRDRVFHGRSRAGLIVALWLRLGGEKRVVATVHSLGRVTWFYRAAALLLRGRIFWLCPTMKRHYGIRPYDWSGCLPDCLPASDWSERRPHRVDPATLRFGGAGSLAPVKQWELILHALALLPRGHSVRFIHAGTTDGTEDSAAYGKRLKLLADALGVSAYVEWRGEVADMGQFYATVDCLVVASKWEASSMAALEAAFRGVPLLASDGSGTRDLIERAKLGLTFTADSPESLAQEMHSLATGAALLELKRDDEGLRQFLAPAVAQLHGDVYARLDGARS